MNCSVLVIEDDDDIREAFEAILELEGYSVVSAADGREALDALERLDEVGLILLDLMMPEVNGWRFRELQRDLGLHLSAPLVIVSGISDDLASEASLLGAVDALAKPIPPTKLLASVEAHCSGSSRNARG